MSSHSGFLDIPRRVIITVKLEQTIGQDTSAELGTVVWWSLGLANAAQIADTKVCKEPCGGRTGSIGMEAMRMVIEEKQWTGLRL